MYHIRFESIQSINYNLINDFVSFFPLVNKSDEITMTLNDHHIISYCWLIVKKKLVFMLITSRFYFFVCLMASDVTERQALISMDWNVIIQSKSIK